MRDPVLREKAGTWWAEQREEGEWGREDDDVRRMAGALGLGYGESEGASRGEGNGVGHGNGNVGEKVGEGKLASSARVAVEALRHGYKPGEFL